MTATEALDYLEYLTVIEPSCSEKKAEEAIEVLRRCLVAVLEE